MLKQEPLVLHGAEAKAAGDAADAIGALALDLQSHESVTLTAGGEVSVEVPSEVFRLFGEMLSMLADGSGVVVLPDDAELTTQQAADLINVSRPYLVKLIDDGDLPGRLVGTHRRVLLSDLLAFKKLADKRGREALEDLTALSQELGIDY